jgi:hypothetical protein
VKTAAITTALALLLAAAGAREAAAQSDRSSHERVKASAIKKNGEVVGLRLKLTLRPVDDARPVVRIGLGPNDPAKYDYATFRDQASDPTKGYLLHQFPEITLDKKEIGQGKAKEITLEVMYADAPELAKWDPAKEVEVISAWSDKTASVYWHVWGMQGWTADKASLFKLPAAKKTAGKPAKKAVRRLAALRTSAARKLTTARRATARALTARRPVLRTRFGRR